MPNNTTYYFAISAVVGNVESNLSDEVNASITSGMDDTVNWNKSFSSAGTSADGANAVATDGSGNVYVVGTGTNLVNATSGTDWWIKIFSPTGVEDMVNWNKTLNSGNGSADVAQDIAIDLNGNIYVVGFATNLVSATSGTDWWIKKFYP